MNDFTILIQGPIHENGLNYISHYRNYCNTFISTWNDENIDKIKKYNHISMDKFQPECFNRGNIYFQTLTTLNGLKLINSKYTIKLRFDEYFTNLQPIFDSVIKNPEKLTCSNIFLNKDYPLNMSDHIIAGKTYNMKTMFEITKHLCEVNKPSKEMLEGNYLGLNTNKTTTEVILFTSYLRSKGINPDVNICKKLWQENLTIVDIEKLGDFRVMCNTNNVMLNRPKQVIAHSDGIRTVYDL